MKKVGCNMMVLGRYRIKVTGFELMTLCTHNRCADAPHPFEKRNSVRYSISPASHRWRGPINRSITDKLRNRKTLLL